MYEVGDEVVYCPISPAVAFFEASKKVGADGEVISRETSCRTKKGKNGERIKKPPKVKAVNVKWKHYRNGVSVFKLNKKTKTREKNIASKRFVELGAHIHPLSYCNDCPLRLRRLVEPCGMTKEQAIRKYGPIV